jgi:hypothetical protein
MLATAKKLAGIDSEAQRQAELAQLEIDLKANAADRQRMLSRQSHLHAIGLGAMLDKQEQGRQAERDVQAKRRLELQRQEWSEQITAIERRIDKIHTQQHEFKAAGNTAAVDALAANIRKLEVERDALNQKLRGK